MPTCLLVAWYDSTDLRRGVLQGTKQLLSPQRSRLPALLSLLRPHLLPAQPLTQRQHQCALSMQNMHLEIPGPVSQPWCYASEGAGCVKLYPLHVPAS